MFTGIVEGLGIVRGIHKKAAGAIFSVEGKKVCKDIAIGDSISVNGICLTVTDNSNGFLEFDVLGETLKKSNIGTLKAADRINLERALKADSRLGGHFVTGHIDCVAKIKQKQQIGDTYKMQFYTVNEYSIYLVPKGCVAIDGISLTVGEVSRDYFTVYVIPHTLTNTTLGFKKEGDVVNIEFDILAKYVNKSIPRTEKSKINNEFLSKNGFI